MHATVSRIGGSVVYSRLHCRWTSRTFSILQYYFKIAFRCSNDNLGYILMLLINLSRSEASITYVSLICLENIILHQGSSTFWVRGPIYIFHIILRVRVIADYKIIMDKLNIIIGAWAAPPHSPILTSLHLRHTSAALPTSQLILQTFRCFTYVRGISPMSQHILQPFRRFIYATAHSPTLPLLHICQRHFTYFTWRPAHA